MRVRAVFGAVGLCALAAAAPARAQSAPAAPTSAPATDNAASTSRAAKPATSAAAVSEVVVTGRRLNAARQAIEPSLGATSYTVTNATIQKLPGGDNQQLNQVILQLPGVVQDSFGQFHVRDDHNGLQYRINGVILPEGISVFGQTLTPRIVEKLDLITGALPAQYGLRTGGIVDITTKSGLFDGGGQVGVYGGSRGVYEPSFQYGDHIGDTNVVVTGDYRRTQIGIEGPDNRPTPVHDRADEINLFAYADRILSQNDRLTLIGGVSNDRFQIPDTAGLQPTLGYTVDGRTDYPSALLNETQRETNDFLIASLLHDQGKLTLQTSAFIRYSTLTYRPDPHLGDLLYTGVSQQAAKRDLSFGLQTEGVYRLNPAHTLRGGVIVQFDRATSRTTADVLALGADGLQTSDTPLTVADDGAKTQKTYSVFLQDEWKLLPSLTFNYGARYDDFNAYRSQDQISPRANLVWTPLEGTTLHGGYARYFTPPPFELVGSQTVAKFAGTSAASPGVADTTPFAERSNYFDVGVQQRLTHALTFGLDGYIKRSRLLLDEGQFGAPIILTPFNYADGKISGFDLSLTYAEGPLSGYFNVGYARGRGKDIVTSQFNFSPADLATIAGQYIFLDHDQTWTSSAGIAYAFRDGVLDGTQLSADALYGSGLRAAGAVPNGRELPSYIQVNLSASHRLTVPVAGRLEARFDIINLADKVYEIRDGSGVGVGAPQFGPRRAYYFGLTKFF